MEEQQRHLTKQKELRVKEYKEKSRQLSNEREETIGQKKNFTKKIQTNT